MSSTSKIHYVSDAALTWHRHKQGRGFQYADRYGHPLRGDSLDRVKKLVIPPAWTDVQISPDENSHIQAVGFDARGRKQYIYNEEWALQNQEQKFDKLTRFGEILPPLRETIAGHMRQHTLSRERIIATVVWLLEHTFIRIGNKEYARENNSYGLTTMREKHVEVDGNTITFSFKGKSGVYHELDVRHPRVAKTIRECIELPGYELFQYIADDNSRQVVDSRDVNEYLQQVTGETLSAKDFRTWGGTTLAANTLYLQGSPDSETFAKKAVQTAVKDVAHHLQNTVTVSRKYYIHPYVYKSYEQDILVPHFRSILKKATLPTELSPDEYATWTLLKEQK